MFNQSDGKAQKVWKALIAPTSCPAIQDIFAA
jgi:hypothetical protein